MAYQSKYTGAQIEAKLDAALTEHQDISGKADRSSLSSVATSGSYNDLSDKPTIPSVAGLASEQWVTSQGYLTSHQDISGKQDVISDLAAIRSGAALGATALQSHQSLSGYATESWVNGKNYLTSHQDISGKQDALSAAQLAAVNSGITSSKVSTYDGYSSTIANKVDKVSGKGLSTNDYTTAEKNKLSAISEYTIGEGLTVENGVLKCSFVPTRYYTGSTDPINTQGNNGDLYLQIK